MSMDRTSEQHTALSVSESPAVSQTESPAGFVQERLATAQQQADMLRPEPVSVAELTALIEGLPEETQQQVWTEVLRSQSFLEANPLIQKLGLVDILCACPPHPERQQRLAPGWQFWNTYTRSQEDVFIERLSKEMEVGIFRNPGLKSRGLAYHGDGAEPLIYYREALKPVPERLLGLARDGLLDLELSVLIHEYIHTRLRKKTLQNPDAMDQIRQDTTRTNRFLADNEANALLSDPGYQIYEYLEDKTFESLTQFIDEEAYKHIPKEEFEYSLNLVTQLLALDYDSATLAEHIGSGGLLEELLEQKLNERGLDRASLGTLVHAWKLERNNARIRVRQEVRQRLQDQRSIVDLQVALQQQTQAARRKAA